MDSSEGFLAIDSLTVVERSEASVNLRAELCKLGGASLFMFLKKAERFSYDLTR